IVNTYLIGKAVGHYHVELASLNPLHLASAELKYTFKLLFFGRLWPYPIQDTIYGTLSAPLAGGLALAALLGFAAWVLIRRKSLNNKLLFNTFLLFGAVLFILPIAHLYFYYLQYSENDRYTYFSLVFVCMLLPSLLWRYRFGRFALGLYLAISVAATLHFNRLWQQSDQVHDHLAETFRWHDRSEVYLLNVPDNLRGMFMFRNIGGDSAFEEVLTLLKGDSVQAKIYDIYQYNMATPQDGVSAVQINDSTYQATFNQWGNWWWRNGIGGTPYRTDKYVTQIDGQSFSVTFKQMADDAAVIYFDGSDWQELD
ncbi:MAG: hypothetical protein R3301_09745, partial [Saprospiraceae bacterium]|nr:hypothetical protein [Saprospiraceae bacterium]